MYLQIVECLHVKKGFSCQKDSLQQFVMDEKLQYPAIFFSKVVSQKMRLKGSYYYLSIEKKFNIKGFSFYSLIFANNTPFQMRAYSQIIIFYIVGFV